MKILLLLATLIQVAHAQPNPASQVSIQVPQNLEGTLKMRDPFRRFMPKKDRNELASVLPDIEKFTVEQFRLIGVITGPKKHKALLSGPNGKIHILGESAKIGPRKGVIKKITGNSIWVEEKVINILGEEERIETTIELAASTSTAATSTSPNPNLNPGIGSNFNPPSNSNFNQPPFQNPPAPNFQPPKEQGL